MTTEQRPNRFRDVSPGVLMAAAVILVAAAILVHGVFPRYEFRLIQDGHAMVIYDRWAGKFQRANYDENGEPSLSRVVTPF
jgi:hypothetical protein